MRRTRPSSAGSRCRKNRSRFGKVTTHWRRSQARTPASATFTASRSDRSGSKLPPHHSYIWSQCSSCRGSAIAATAARTFPFQSCRKHSTGAVANCRPRPGRIRSCLGARRPRRARAGTAWSTIARPGQRLHSQTFCSHQESVVACRNASVDCGRVRHRNRSGAARRRPRDSPKDLERPGQASDGMTACCSHGLAV